MESIGLESARTNQGSIEKVRAKEQVAYLVDMAKADALDLPGESRQALELVDRHV
ncbi:MAG: hypothetical protein O7C75_21405 [Verrucomicrobia bacterium]|nr:hypothetical protein [Verrucomicrobiota bacterium]